MNQINIFNYNYKLGTSYIYEQNIKGVRGVLQGRDRESIYNILNYCNTTNLIKINLGKWG